MYLSLNWSCVRLGSGGAWTGLELTKESGSGQAFVQLGIGSGWDQVGLAWGYVRVWNQVCVGL